MTSQMDMFPRARKSDHDSSHDAADRLEKSGAAQIQLNETLAALEKFPGSTSKQLHELTGLDRHMLARRLPELVTKGLAKREKPTGKAILWWKK